MEWSVANLLVKWHTSYRTSKHSREGNGNPLQYSCLENPRDGRAWWVVIYGVAQSRTRLKRLSSSSSVFLSGHRLKMSQSQGFQSWWALKALKKEKSSWDLAAIRTSATPYNELQEVQDGMWKNTGHWSRIADMHMKGIISVSLGSGIFAYIEKS